MGMGRPRKHRKDLPERVYFRRQTYYFVSRDGKWHNLGKDYYKAMERLALINSTAMPAHSLTVYIDRYIRDVIPGKAPRTQADNLRELELLRAVFGHMRPEDITPPDIYAYMDRRPKTRGNREKALLSHLYSYMIRWGVAESNPCRLVKRNPERPSTRYIEDDDYLAVREIMPPPVQKAMDISLLTGLRQGDVLRLQKADIKPEGLLVTTGKTGRRLLFEMTDTLAEVLALRLPSKASVGSLWIVHNYQAQRYTSSGFRAQWQKHMRRAIEAGKISQETRFAYKDIRAKAASDGHDDNLLGHQDKKTLYKHYKRKPIKVTPIR